MDPNDEWLLKRLDKYRAEALPAPGSPSANSTPPTWTEKTTITTATSLAAESPVQAIFRGRRPGIQDLTPKERHVS